VDKGGLVFQPPVGVFAHVAELDYASMYPTIMVKHNVSAETLFCHCSDNQAVPEAGYAICTRRRGLIPQLLAPLLARRAYYKARLRQPTLDPTLAQRYEACQSALKWIGVTCFGYLGYHNARFGRIESHEAVTAFGREKLLRMRSPKPTAIRCCTRSPTPSGFSKAMSLRRPWRPSVPRSRA
jgi:DNA polymerase II